MMFEKASHMVDETMSASIVASSLSSILHNLLLDFSQLMQPSASTFAVSALWW
jgi:hypothetical protein